MTGGWIFKKMIFDHSRLSIVQLESLLLCHNFFCFDILKDGQFSTVIVLPGWNISHSNPARARRGGRTRTPTDGRWERRSRRGSSRCFDALRRSESFRPSVLPSLVRPTHRSIYRSIGSIGSKEGRKDGGTEEREEKCAPPRSCSPWAPMI